MARNHTAALCSFATGITAADLPPAALDRCKAHLLDTIGVALQGARTAHAQAAAGTVRDFRGAPESTVLGHGFRTVAGEAAFANGVAAHSIDFDDGHKFVHPGAAVVPTALALAERDHLSGPQLIAALTAGYEVAVRVSLAAGLRHRDRGWHPTGTCNIFGAAASAGRLLGLDAAQLASALGIAASQASGICEYRFDGSPTKHLHAGFAARGGTLAALLASRGFRGPAGALEGPFGFLEVLAEGGQPAALSAGLGEGLAIAGTDLKPYPSCRQTHAPADLALAAVHEHGVRADAIAQATLEIYAYAYKSWLVSTDPPESSLAAMLNIPYCLAAALVDGALTLAQFEPARLGDPQIHSLARRITIATNDDFTGAWPDQRRARLRLILTDGREVVLAAVNPRGGIDAPLDFAEVEAKFRGLAVPVIGAETTDRVVAAIARLEQLEDAASLAGLPAAPSPAAASAVA